MSQCYHLHIYLHYYYGSLLPAHCQSGKPMGVIHGADGPQLLANIRQLLQVEVAAMKGKGERPVVSEES